MNTETKTIEEIREKYGSVSGMIAIVDNEVDRLRKHEGHAGRDGADTLDRAIRLIPSEYHPVFYRYHSTFPRP